MLVLIRERTQIREPLFERLDALRTGRGQSSVHGSRINKYHGRRYFKETETDLSVDEFRAVIDS